MWGRHAAAASVPPASMPATGGARWVVPLVAIGLGVAADAVLEGPPGLGVVLVLLATTAGLVMLAKPMRAGIAFAGAAALVGGFVVLRASAPLVLLDLVVAAGLLCWASGFARASTLWVTARAYLRRGIGTLGAGLGGARLLAAPSVQVARSIDGPQARSISRALVVAIPLIGVLLGLLASADAVYGHLLGSALDVAQLGEIPRHVVTIGTVALGFAALVAHAAREPQPVDRPLGGRVAPLEWKILLAGVDALFLSFVVVQAATLFGGREHLVSQAGLTVAEYARSGFFQLLVVAAITAALLIATATWGRRERARDVRAFTALAAVMIVLTLAMLASSFQRLALYEETFGFTRLRLAVHGTILVLGAMLACGLVAVLTRRARWLPAAVVAIGLVGVLGANLIDPDAFIARHNLARAARGHDLDVQLVTSLSSDAAPPILAALPTLPRDDARALESWLACGAEQLRGSIAEHGWVVFHVGRDRAVEMVLAAGLAPCDA